MSDLKERLRARKSVCDYYGNAGTVLVNPDGESAIARIEELEAELANGSFYQEKDIDAMQARIEELEAENKKLRLEVYHANDVTNAAIENTRDVEAKLSIAVCALEYYADKKREGLPSDGPWGINSNDFGKHARTTLLKLT